ncbi:MAG TPA: hypothetical protein VFR62_06515 [Gemmatimonadales bacterium]|nr:hypothetical protein [Gemmatimonadales bacterium]
MHTTRTTILSDDPQTAQEEFDHWVHHEAVVLLVIFGTGLSVEQTVEDADGLANNLSDLAHVLWARERSAIQDQVSALQASQTLRKQLRDCQGLSLSLSDKVVDVLRSSEPAPDLTRLFELFNNALDDLGLGT